MNESFGGKSTRRDFLKTAGAYLAGKTLGLDKLSNLAEDTSPDKQELTTEELVALEATVFPRVQELLKKSGWKGYRSFKDGVFYLTNDQWMKGPVSLRKEIRDIFYADMEKVANARSIKSGINPKTYVMMTAKESNFGTSELAQIANNPFSINVVGKEDVLSDAKYPNKIKWNDDDTIYYFYKFISLGESCQAFEELHAFWKKKFPEYKNLKTLTAEQSIEILAKYWNAGKNGAKKDYTDWLERVTNKRY